MGRRNQRFKYLNVSEASVHHVCGLPDDLDYVLTDGIPLSIQP